MQNLIDPDPKVLVKFDYSTATPIRDKNGRCIKVKPGGFITCSQGGAPQDGVCVCVCVCVCEGGLC